VKAKIPLSLVLLGLFLSLVQGQKSVRKSVRNVTGHYQLKKAETRNSFEVQELAGNRIKFHILALWISPYNPENVHNGEVFGTVLRKGNTAVYEEERCKLTIKFTASGAVVDQNEEVGDCDFGANVTASGIYRKLNSRTPVFEN
jgi:hypothetical protein